MFFSILSRSCLHMHIVQSLRYGRDAILPGLRVGDIAHHCPGLELRAPLLGCADMTRLMFAASCSFPEAAHPAPARVPLPRVLAASGDRSTHSVLLPRTI